jgi:Protein of unknown function (DUF502)
MDGSTTEASLKLTGRSRLGRILRNKFVAGLIILIPIVLTVKGLWWLFSYVDGLAQPLAVRVLGRTIWGVGIVITVGVVFLTGFLFSKGPLKKVLDGLEDLLDDVPLVGTVYGTTKKVLSGFGSQQAEQAFQSFVFAQLPGRTTPGFLMKTFELKRRRDPARGRRHPDRPDGRGRRRHDPVGGRFGAGADRRALAPDHALPLRGGAAAREAAPVPGGGGDARSRVHHRGAAPA